MVKVSDRTTNPDRYVNVSAGGNFRLTFFHQINNMAFQKQNLQYVHYRWETSGEPAASIYSGEPARRHFDPFNGDQVLFLINYYDTMVGGINLRQAHLIENKIAYRLPIGMKSEKSVLAWLMEQVLEDATDLTAHE